MLSETEVTARFKFYKGVFPGKNVSGSSFPDKLWPVCNYDDKITGLTARGFENPQKMITSSPSILGLSFDNIDEKIAGLTTRGFKNPQKMITSSPSILSYSFDKIDDKITGLTARGFENPQKMITSLPSILGLSFDNIDRKLRLCRRLGVDINNFINYTIVFVGMSSKNYIPILRQCNRLGCNPSPQNVFRIYSKRTF